MNWGTAGEINNDYFTIERSVDLVNIETLTQVKGKGTTLSATHYTFYDTHPLTGTSYYRLKQTDFNGDYVYYEWVPVKRNPGYNIFPNPVRDELVISFGEQSAQVQVQLISLNGKVVTEQMYTNVTSAKIDAITQLENGIYVLKIITPLETFTEKIIVAR